MDLGESIGQVGTTNEYNVQLLEAYNRGKIDINFFAAMCMPDVCIFSLPQFYFAVWQLLTNRNPQDVGKLLRFALGLPRGHAKTTFIKVLICWLIVYDKASFILILCSNSDLAEKLLADIHDIMRSPNIVQVYGNWEEALAIDSADTKKAAYHSRSVSMVARGWSAGVRGINLQNQRPDVIFCDDVQTKKNDESPTESLTLLQELVGTIFKAIAPRGNRLIIYVGNMYSEECILNKFKKSPSWISMITGAILQDGTPLWPDLFSLEELMESYYHDADLNMADIWFAEVMNDPKCKAKALLPNPLPDPDVDEIIEADGAFITIDPAGFRKDSDDNVIAVHLKFNNKGYITEASKGIMDPMELIREALRLALKWGCTLIGVESVAYQQTLKFWIEYFLTELHITHITVVELSPHGRSKEARIRQFVSELYLQNYYLLGKEIRRDFVWQATMYKIGKKDNKDDLLDAVAYGIDIRNEYWHLLIPPLRGLAIEGECSVVPCNTPF